MSVRKFRSVEELPDPAPLRTVLESLASACELGWASSRLGHAPATLPRGVRKFRSAQLADEARRDHEDGLNGE